MSKLALGLFWIAAVVFILAASAASAQTYPADVVSLTGGTEDATSEPGLSVDVTTAATDANGYLSVGSAVSFTIRSNAGNASFGNGQQTITTTTKADGVAVVMLKTDAAGGTIVARMAAS